MKSWPYVPGVPAKVPRDQYERLVRQGAEVQQ